MHLLRTLNVKPPTTYSFSLKHTMLAVKRGTLRLGISCHSLVEGLNTSQVLIPLQSVRRPPAIKTFPFMAAPKALLLPSFMFATSSQLLLVGSNRVAADETLPVGGLPPITYRNCSVAKTQGSVRWVGETPISSQQFFSSSYL